MANITLAQARDGFLAQMQQAGNLIRGILPKHVQFEQVLAHMGTHLRENPKLLECSQASLFWAFVHAAELGLTIGGFAGEAYILPFRAKGSDTKRANFVPGYKGLIKLAYQSSFIAAIDAWVVYETDVFEVDLGKDANPVVYKPALGVSDPGKVVAAYCKTRLTTGATKHEVMPLWRLERVRRSSPGVSDASHPWNTHTDEMYRKTVLRHALKDVPKSSEIDRALALDDASERDDFEVAEVPGLAAEPDAGRAQRSRARVQERAQAAQLPPAAPPQATVPQGAGELAGAPVARAQPAPAPAQPAAQTEIVEPEQEDMFS